MKNRMNDYPNISELPPESISINKLAKKLGYSTAHIYKLYRNNQLKDKGWDIVVYEDFNFAIPVLKED